MCAVIKCALSMKSRQTWLPGGGRAEEADNCTPVLPKAGSAPDAVHRLTPPKMRRSVGSRTRGGLDVQWRDSPC